MTAPGALRALAGGVVLVVMMLAAPAAAQEATSTPAATQPSVGAWYLRLKLQHDLHDSGAVAGRHGRDLLVASTILARGLTRDLSVSADLPFVHRGEDDGTGGASGLADPSVTLKWRPWQRDLGPVDSVRFAVYGGLEIPSGDADVSSESWDPFAGGVVTAILGRHGFNQSLSYKLNGGDRAGLPRAGDGPEDALRHDTAYLYRLSPAAYSATTTAATYLTLELNGLRETDGGHRVFLAPGLLYEARTFALEATVGWPLVQDLTGRADVDLRTTLGARFLF